MRSFLDKDKGGGREYGVGSLCQSVAPSCVLTAFVVCSSVRDRVVRWFMSFGAGYDLYIQQYVSVIVCGWLILKAKVFLLLFRSKLLFSSYYCSLIFSRFRVSPRFFLLFFLLLLSSFRVETRGMRFSVFKSLTPICLTPRPLQKRQRKERRRIQRAQAPLHLLSYEILKHSE